MAKIVEVKKTFVIELDDKESFALYKLLDTTSVNVDYYRQAKPYINTLFKLKEIIRPYFDEIPF